MCPGRAKSSLVVLGEASRTEVVARSVALIPVVIPERRSFEKGML